MGSLPPSALELMSDWLSYFLLLLQYLASADNANSTCTLKHTAMATGEKCPANVMCISGKI